MEPLNNKDLLKKKFLDREIKPSADSWNRLNERLTNEKKSSTTRFWWMSMAASIVGGILILSLVYNSNSTSTIESFVNTPESKIENKESVIEDENSSDAQIASEDDIISEKTENLTAKSTNSNATQDITNINRKQNNTIATATASEDKIINSFAPATIQTKIQNPLVAKNDLAIASNSQEKSTNDLNEVDALLTAAMQNTATQKQFENTTITSQQLLEDVEVEVEHRFREKVFEIVKDGYLKAKTAVVNRY